MGEVAQTADAM